MTAWLKVIDHMGPNLWVVAGLAFLAISAIPKLSAKIFPGVGTRAIFAVIGLCLAVSGGWMGREHISSRTIANAPQSTSAIAPEAKEVHAEEKLSIRRAAGVSSVGSSLPTAGLSYFSGKWKNTDAHARGLTRISIKTMGRSVRVHAWVACPPTECDWGEVPGTAFGSGVSDDISNQAQRVTATFETSFSDTVMTLSPADDNTLEADTQTRFTDNSGRSSYSATYTFRH